MAAIWVDPAKTKSFRNLKAFEQWLSKNHDRETELWLKLHKKGSGLPSVTNAEAIDVALCWGWIDGVRKSFDEHSFLQRFSPRKKTSVWSQINRDKVALLTAAGRMTPHGQRHVDAAKADGRWSAAYAPIRSATTDTVPSDLRAAIRKNPRSEDVRDARPPEPVRARVPHEQDEDARRPRAKNPRARRHARARRDPRARAQAPLAAASWQVEENARAPRYAESSGSFPSVRASSAAGLAAATGLARRARCGRSGARPAAAVARARLSAAARGARGAAGAARLARASGLTAGGRTCGAAAAGAARATRAARTARSSLGRGRRNRLRRTVRRAACGEQERT
jgi:uncharacterized protein YdeI (YjbR/CyaY-like superfamily)